jgi:hypothetical protein
MVDMLLKAKFDVHFYVDVTAVELCCAVEAFARALSDESEGVIYISCQAKSSGGEPFLCPKGSHSGGKLRLPSNTGLAL